MKTKSLRKFLLIALLLGSRVLLSQEIHGEPNVWFLLINHYKLSDKWSLNNELHFRFDDYLNDKQQFIVRPSVNYHYSPKLIFSAGYTFVNTYPYGEYPLPRAKPEHNIWEQVTLNHKVEKFSFSHRYRLEHRWQANLIFHSDDGFYHVDDFTFGNRFRYRMTIERPLSDQIFINVFDEFWVKSDGLTNTNFDRNWLYGGFGIHAGDKLTLQAGYMHQFIRNNDNRFERHPTLQLTVDYKFN